EAQHLGVWRHELADRPREIDPLELQQQVALGEDAGEPAILDGEHAADMVLSHEAHRLLEGVLWFEAQRRAWAQEWDRLADGVLVEHAPGAGALRFLESGKLLVGDLGVHDAPPRPAHRSGR